MIITFHASLALVAFTPPPLSHFVSQSNIFPCCVLPRSFKLSQDILISLFSSQGQGQKNFLWRLRTLFMSDLVVSASRNTVLFDFFAVHEIRRFLCRNQMPPEYNIFKKHLKSAYSILSKSLLRLFHPLLVRYESLHKSLKRWAALREFSAVH